MDINRRRFLAGSGLLAVFGCSGPLGRAFAPDKGGLPKFKIGRLTSGPKHHFFGYYGICPWNKSQRRMVCLQSDFRDHFPGPNEPASIGLVDCETGKFTSISRTNAWNLQQGAMLHWNPLNPDTEIIHNDRRGNKIVSVILDVNSGKKRILPRAVSAVGNKGKYALSLTYGRLARLRKTVGYLGTVDPNPDSAAPENDGVFLMDLETGKSKLVVSIAEVYGRLTGRNAELKGRHMWFNHTVFNKNDTRFFFLARAYLAGNRRRTAMFTANTDGSELREVVPFERRVSHFDWRNDRQIVATYVVDGARKHCLFTDGKDDHKVIGGGFLDFDGHCSFSPDREWLVTDRKHRDTLEQSLLLYNLRTKRRVVLCKFDMGEKKYISGDLRCDFHPRWNRTGDAICFDAVEPTGRTRQLHVAYLDFMRT